MHKWKHTLQITHPQVYCFWMTFFNVQSEDPIWNPGSNIQDNKYNDPDLP
jgi:hypothetical protein